MLIGWLALFKHWALAESPNVRESKTALILESTLWIPDSRYWIRDYLSVEFGFRILIVSGIPHTLCCIQDSTSKNFLDSLTKGEQEQSLRTGIFQRNIFKTRLCISRFMN